MEKHFADEQRVLLRIAEFSRGFPVYRVRVVFGAPPQATAGGQLMSRTVHLLSLRTQATIRGLFVILNDLFRSGQCLCRINDGTFLINRRTGVPLLSTQGRRDIVPFVDGSQVDDNLRDMAALLRSSVFRSLSQPISVEEVEHGLLPLMEVDGRANWPAIFYHPSLVPLENRLTLQSRLHQELVKVLWKTDKAKCLMVLGKLDFPRDWHTRVKSNTIMLDMYKGSSYNTLDMTKEVQSFEILRFMRNGDQHGPDKSVAPGATTAGYRAMDIAVMYYAECPLLLHSLLVAMALQAQLGDVSIDSLFCYPPP